jgi:hypothetical protein
MSNTITNDIAAAIAQGKKRLAARAELAEQQRRKEEDEKLKELADNWRPVMAAFMAAMPEWARQYADDPGDHERLIDPWLETGKDGRPEGKRLNLVAYLRRPQQFNKLYVRVPDVGVVGIEIEKVAGKATVVSGWYPVIWELRLDDYTDVHYLYPIFWMEHGRLAADNLARENEMTFEEALAIAAKVNNYETCREEADQRDG